MKRICFFVVIALAVTAAVFAQDYTVQSVTGRVQREAGSNRVNIAVGDVLTAQMVIYTGIGASLVLRDKDNTFTIPGGQNGRRVADLIASGSGVRIGGNVTQTDTGAANRNVGQVSTAAARASDAAVDDGGAEE